MPPLLHLSPPTKEGPSGPLWIPSWSERSPIRASRHTMPRSVGRAATSEWTSRLCGEIQKGAEAPFWSLRRVGGSKGEGDPFERVPFPLGVLLPSFPTREKKVGPQAETLLVVLGSNIFAYLSSGCYLLFSLSLFSNSFTNSGSEVPKHIHICRTSRTSKRL